MNHSSTRQSTTLMLGSSLLFIVIGLGLIASSFFAISTQAQLRTDGQTIIADVVDTQVTRSTKRGSVTSTRYEVKYRFQPSGQAVVTSGWEEAPEDVVRTANRTKQIEIRYVPSDPSVNLPSASVGTESSPPFLSMWPSIVGGGMVLLGGGILLMVLKSLRRPQSSPRHPSMPTLVR